MLLPNMFELDKATQPVIEIFAEVANRPSNFNKRRGRGAFVSVAIHPGLSQKRAAHTNVVSRFNFT